METQEKTLKAAKLALIMASPKAAKNILNSLVGVNFPQNFDKLTEKTQTARINKAINEVLKQESTTAGTVKDIYSSLNDLYNDAKGHQITAQELINGRSNMFGQWQSIKLSNELKESIINYLTDSLGGRTDTKSMIKSILTRGEAQNWALSRFFVEKYGDKPAYLSYCAGQDQSWEMRTARKELLKKY